MKNINSYNPSYFLAALGNGGLATSFFMYLMFMVPHPDTPMVAFNHIYPYLVNGSPLISISIIVAMIGMIYFAVRHFQRLAWNVKQLNQFKKTEAYESLKNSNGAASLMAVPLTLAMMINVLFVLGAVFVPNLWNVIEILLPFALAGFLAVGVYALTLFVPMMARFMTEKVFNVDANNNFSQLLTVFAFTMIAVGFAAPGAMSKNMIVSSMGIFFSILFLTIGVALMLVHTAIALQAIFRHGFAKEAGPSVWMFIPILTLIGITGFRLTSGISHNFLQTKPLPVIFFIALGALVTMQIVIGLVGHSVLKKLDYFSDFIGGKKKSAGSYGLICPGVAFFVLGMFFIHWGLVQTGVVDKFSIAYFLILVPFVLVQLKTIQVLAKLNKKHFASIKQATTNVMEEKAV